ncbi:DUF3519 domain-containing protein [Helicobacter pylori]
MIEDKEAFFKDLNKNLKDNATPLPKGMSIEEFKQSLESVENKDRFLEHLKTRENNPEERLASLNLVEPILREPHIEIFIKDKDGVIVKKEYVKAFKDENKTRLYMLITQDNDTILRTFITDTPERYVRNHVRNADIIHSFIQPNRTAKSDNALSDVVVYENNPTQKDLTDQEDLLKTSENLNETTKDATNLSPLEQANAKKLLKLQHATTQLKEFGTNYPEFALKPKEALEKLLQEKNGQVAGAAYREDLGWIDFVWGNKDYGLEHILKRREDQALNNGINETEAKKYAMSVVKTIPEVIEKGVKVERNGRVAIEYQNIRVGLKDNWKGEKLPNHWVITGYEKRLEDSESLYTSPLITKGETLPLNSNKPNSTTNALKTQETLSEQANAKKLLKLQHATTQLKEFGTNYPEFALKPKEALEKLLQEKNGQVAGAAYREDLGGIDFVWGTPKTKDGNGYGLAHILDRRISNEMKKGLSETEAKEYAVNIVKSIPEVLEKGTKGTDHLGRVFVEYGNKRVGLNNEWKNEKLENHWVISSYELYDTEKQALRSTPQAITKEKAFNSLNSVESNPTPKPLTDQEDLLKNTENLNETTKDATNLSPLEQANAKKLLKLESEKGIKAEALKKLDFNGIKKLIDESPRTGSSMPILGMQNLSAEAVEYIQKNHKRIAVEKIEPSFAKDLKLKYPDDARAVIDYQAINHILKEHKNLSFEDIANYRELSKQANETLKLKDNQNRPVVASFNQINGFFVVVEQVSNAKNELMLKTMYKARGDYKDSLIYKRTLAKSQNSN